MARKLTTTIAAALLALGLMAGAAFAAVTFDDDNGSGFVGKGDVQTAFGWKNATMQNNHLGVGFRYVASTTYAFDCEWYAGPDHNRKRHENTKEAVTGINAALASDSRKTGQYTGWNLLGYAGGGPSAPGEPTNADCGAEGNANKTIVPGTVEVLSSASELYAAHNGSERLIWSR